MATGELGGRSAEKLFSLSGLFAVYKPKGPTSAAVLNLLKERLLAEAGVQTKDNKRKRQALKIGHGGTLDSAATGVLGNEKYKYSHRTSMEDASVPTCGGRGMAWDLCSRYCGFGLLEKSTLGYISFLCTCTCI
uniref:TruB pseudouridine synthase family member 1 n=1 Tax=Pavo cristatus TaxID=9049 RepID=A0A8C9FPN3_PAVCR